MTRKAWCAAAIAVALAGCHTITEELPTQPTESPGSGILTLPIPSIPLPTATPGPAPQPTATPGATPPPAPQPTPEPPPPPGAGSCGNPVPPPIGRVNVKIHIRGPRMYTLDSTPQVVDAAYCAAIGFTGRQACPVRPEGHPEREACEKYAVGNARDTGRPGPTWTRNGNYCTGGASGCENHPDNQYLLFAIEGGTYEACVKGGVCGSITFER